MLDAYKSQTPLHTSAPRSTYFSATDSIRSPYHLHCVSVLGFRLVLQPVEHLQLPNQGVFTCGVVPQQPEKVSVLKNFSENNNIKYDYLYHYLLIFQQM